MLTYRLNGTTGSIGVDRDERHDCPPGPRNKQRPDQSHIFSAHGAADSPASLLTWIEEFFNIAGPGNSAATSFMVIGIIVTALSFFLVFERRTFCRYVCPLTSLIGTVGAMGSVAGFRTRDRELCLNCTTKECMRGGENGFGCPW